MQTTLIVGPGATGKSLLAHALADQFGRSHPTSIISRTVCGIKNALEARRDVAQRYPACTHLIVECLVDRVQMNVTESAVLCQAFDIIVKTQRNNREG